MLSRNRIPAPEASTYRVSQSDSARIRQWLQQSRNNYQSEPAYSSSFEYSPINYEFCLKKIKVEEWFLNKHIRAFNKVAPNGLRIMAAIYSEASKMYIARPYQKKGVLHKFDLVTRNIEILEDIHLIFYVLDERVPGTAYPEGSPSLKNLTLNISIELVSSDGESFGLGSLKFNLANRLKAAISDLQMFRVGQPEKTCIVECEIDSPERTGLSQLLTPNIIIDQNTAVAPAVTQLKNKAHIFTITTAYSIRLDSLEVCINNYGSLLKNISRCRPFFTDHHNDNISMEVMRVSLVLGLHNGWRLLTDLPGHRDKEKHNNVPQNVTNKNMSRLIAQKVESVLKDNRKHSQGTVYHARSMVEVVEGGEQSQVKRFKLDAHSNLGNSLELSKLAGSSQAVDLLYFPRGGQLIGILQFTVKFKLSATIKQQKVLNLNAFWVPLAFDTAESVCSVCVPMISHIDLPGYPVQWASNTMVKEVSAELKFNCLNDNPDLHQASRKQRLRPSASYITSMTNISSINESTEKDYLETLMEEIEHEKNQGRRPTQQSIVSMTTFNKTRLHTKAPTIQQNDEKITKTLRMLEQTLKPRLRLSSTPVLPLQSPASTQRKQQLGLSLIGKSFQFRLRLREYLPTTDDSTHYYIPRTMTVKIMAFRHLFDICAVIDKDNVKANIPIQLRNPKKQDYQGYTFNLTIPHIDEQEAGAIEEGNNFIVSVYDSENMMQYSVGHYPAYNFFTSQHPGQNKQPDTYTNHFKLELVSCLTPVYICGCLLFEYSINQTQGPEASHNLVQPISMDTLARQISLHERQKLRIQTYQDKAQAEDTKRALIDKYKLNSVRKYANQIVNKQYNNDLQLVYEVGKPCFGWLPLNNTDKSGNNLFTFHLDCDEVELVTDKALYQRTALTEAKKNQESEWKKMPGLAYVMPASQKQEGYYEANIAEGTQVDLLLKVLFNQWSDRAPEVRMASIQVRRNTFPFRKYKIKLTLKRPFIDRLYHHVLTLSSSQSLRLPLPTNFLAQHGDNLYILSAQITYSPKQQTIIIRKQPADCPANMPILIGVYYDKAHQMLKKTILLQVECIWGQRLALNVGEARGVQVPVLGEGMAVRDRVYRVEVSNGEYLWGGGQRRRLHYYSEVEQNWPSVEVQCLRPVRDVLVVSLINLEGNLVRKYALQLQCTIPKRCPAQKVTIEGYAGEKFPIILKNPYQIDFSFCLMSSHLGLHYRNLETDANNCIRIKSKSAIKVICELDSPLPRDQQYIILGDCDNHTVAVFQLRAISHPRHKFESDQNFFLSPDRLAKLSMPEFGALRTG